MIYIDPPYNTGNDFVYPDNYSESLETYLRYTGKVSDEGFKTTTNSKDNGRFHSNWLRMMYPRLYVAKNLLRDDGVIFISIGEVEVGNLRGLCDHIFGENNFIASISRVMKSEGAKGTFFTPNTDYILCYASDVEKADPFRLPITADQIKTYYKFTQKTGSRANEQYGEERLFKASLDPRPNQRYWIKCPDGSYAIPPGEVYPDKIKNGAQVTPTANDGVWKWIYSTYKKEYDDGNIIFKKSTKTALLDQNQKPAKWNIYNKLWLKDQQAKGKVPGTFLNDIENRLSSAELKTIDIPFDYAKPTKLVDYLVRLSRAKPNDIILDFFSGSGTTAHAVMALNSEDGGKRRCISIQLPEPCDPKSEAGKAGYATIADIAKERIRRAGNKIREELEAKAKESEGELDLNQQSEICNPQSVDLGFRVFKLTRSNFKKWDGEAAAESDDAMKQQMLDNLDHIAPHATPEGLLYEILLGEGYALTCPVEEIELAGQRVFSVEHGKLLLYLDDKLQHATVEAAVELAPDRFVCLDRSLQGDDALKVNTMETLRNASPEIQFRTV